MHLTVEQFATFQDTLAAWQQLLAADSSPTFFSTPAWLETWWHHHSMGRQLVLLVVRKGTVSVGFAPMMIEPLTAGRSIQFLGTGLSDYADILADESQSDRKSVVRAVLDFMAEKYPDALFDLQEIPASSPTVALIEGWLKDRKLRTQTVPQDICPVVDLPETAELYHKQLRKSFLADIRRGERRLRERGEVALVDHIRPSDGDWTSLRNQMSELQSQRMRTKGEIPLWQGPLGAFVKDVLAATDAAHQLRLTGLYLDGKLTAYELCFLHRTTIFAWSRAFDEEHRNTGPGKVALLHLLETGIAQGYRTFDLLRGEEPYKELWTNGHVRNMRILFVVRPTPGAWVAYKYRTSWKAQLQKLRFLRRLNRFLKSLRGGK